MANSNLVFATRNKNKVEEVNSILASIPVLNQNLPTILSLDDIHCQEEIPETSPTIQANALQKAQYVFDHYQKNCFAEDTGLIIPSLDGEPGVRSARYAGTERSAEKNMAMVLQKLADSNERSASFLTAIALVVNGKAEIFEGQVHGKITLIPRGQGGFGYDPIFQPDGYSQTFAEMNPEEKNRISHRFRAMKKLIRYLTRQNPR